MSYPVGHFTRGGQLVTHRVRMFTQAFRITIWAALGSCLIYLIWKIHMEIPPQGLYLTVCAYWVECKISIATFFYGPHATKSMTIRVWDRGWHFLLVQDFLRNPLIQQRIATFWQGLSAVGSWKTFYHLCCVSLIGPISTVAVFWWRGREGRELITERGNCLIASEKLTALLKKKKQDSSLTLDGVPFVRGKETSHILITGTTGSGKSNCFHTLLPQLRAKGQSAVVLDLTGEFTQRYYRENHDLILNPFDARSRAWTPFVECSKPTHFRALAESIIPIASKTDSFWERAAQTILTVGLEKMKFSNGTLQDLFHLLVQADAQAFESFFAGTEAAPYTAKEGDRMTLSIRATLSNHLQSFKYLNAPVLNQDSEIFSIRNWIARDPQDQWLFLGCQADERAVMRPLMTGWIDIAINALMSCAPDPQRRLWFIMDEMPALHKIPGLGVGLAELRKYGGCILSGIQNIAQMEETYNGMQSRALLDLYNTKVFFRSTDVETTQWISRALGESEITENVENTSFGAHTMRDGVSTSKQTRTKPLVLPSEISDLQDLECYIKLPGAWPMTKKKLSFKKGKAHA